MVFIRYVVYVYNMALNTNIWVVLLIFGLKIDLVHGVRNTCVFPDVPQNSELTQSVDRDHVFQEGDVVQYLCKNGLSFEGHLRRTCTDGQWTNVRFTCYAAPVCDEISPFYGGKPMLSNGLRKEHALALLRCDNGYSLYPTGINVTKCKTTRSGELEWTPEPPLCYKKLKVKVPNNCHTRSSNVELTHKQSFTLTPSTDYEFYPTKNYLTSSSLTITNNNGTFDPPLPQCVPERCDARSLQNRNNLHVYYPNNTRATGQVDSHTNYNLGCMDNYEYGGQDYLNKEYVVRRCEYGHFKNVPPCIEKRCYLTNNQLDLTTSQGRRSSLKLVEHSIRVDVNCKSGRHELYSNASQVYVNPFSTRCEYGQFNREVNLLNCVPKRCNTKNLLNMNVYQLNGASVSRMVDSHHKYKLACTDKYEFKGESYLDTPSIERTCENGDFVNVPKCVEKRCSLINTNIRLTLQTSQRSLHQVAHGRQVDVRCKLNRLQLFNPTSRKYLTDFSTECQFGHFDKEVNSLACVPKPCNTRLLAHTKVFNADEIRVEGLLEGGISYKLTCESVQYVFKDYPNDGYIESRCENGSFQNVSSCIERPCKLLNTDKNLQFRFNTRADPIADGYIVQHNAEIFVSCKSDYELYYNRTNILLGVNETTSTCVYGNMGEIPNCAETAPVCDEISPFYGGKPMLSNGLRKEHALALLRCDNGYSLYPTGINSIRCKQTLSGELEWTPEPPLCYKKLKVKVPNNCHTRSSNVELTHKQSFTLTPSTDYEFYATKNYLTSSSLTITNNNGTFDPPLPQCVPERCDARSLQNRKNVHVYYPNNNTRATGQVDSHTNYNLGCMDNYEFDGQDYRNKEHVVRRCEFGQFVDVPPCKAKTDFKYVVRIQVADKMYAGTDGNIYVRIYGNEENTATFKMIGAFDRNMLEETVFRGIYVGQIRTVVVSKDKLLLFANELNIVYVSIYIEDSDDYYVLTYRDQPDVWLSERKPLELSIARHPECCIHTYGEAMNRIPKQGNHSTYIDYISLRECKQRCATTRSLSCKSIYVMLDTQRELLFGHCYHNTHSPDNNIYFRDYIVHGVRFQYVSYERKCREP